MTGLPVILALAVFYVAMLLFGLSLARAAATGDRCPPHRPIDDTCVKCGRTVTGR